MMRWRTGGPVTEEGRVETLAALDEARGKGDNESAAKCLLKLSFLTKWIGSGSEKPWYEAYQEYVAEAWQLAEPTDNSKLKSSVLRAASLAFLYPPDVRSQNLEAALALSQSVNDLSGMGHVLLAFGQGGRGGNHPDSKPIRLQYLRDALDLFEEAGERHAMAQVLSVIALHDASLSSMDKGKMRLQASKFYLDADNPRESARSLITSLWLDKEIWDASTCIEIAERAAEFAKAAGESLLAAEAFGACSRALAEKSEESLSKYYADKEDAYDIELYGSRRGRLEHDIKGLKEAIEVATRGEKKKLKAKLDRLDLELQAEITKEHES